MPWDLKKELKRKAIHLLSISFIVIFVLVSASYGKELAFLSLVFLLVLLIEIDYVRVELGKKIPIFWRMFRKKEEERHGGQVFFLIGAIICLAVFDFKIALAAVLMTTFGDMAAVLIGKRFGRTWITKDRALEGILAELFVDLAIAYFIFGFFGFNWVVVVVMALTATIAESAISKLDDNLIVPLFAGFNGQIALYILKMLKLN